MHGLVVGRGFRVSRDYIFVFVENDISGWGCWCAVLLVVVVIVVTLMLVLIVVMVVGEVHAKLKLGQGS